MTLPSGAVSGRSFPLAGGSSVKPRIPLPGFSRGVSLAPLVSRGPRGGRVWPCLSESGARW